MRAKIVKPERRLLERRSTRLASLGEVVAESPWADRRVQCWNLEAACTEDVRKRCSAYFVRRNCWDLWAAEFFPAGRRPCCHPDRDCSDCSVAVAKFDGDIAIYVEIPSRNGAKSEPAAAYCRSLYNPVQLGSDLEGEARSEFRCRRRPGIWLHESYVSDVCSCVDHRECVFYEAE